MKTCTKSFVIVKQIRLLCVSILMLGASVVYADPAAIIDDFGCGTFVLDENGDTLGWVSTDTESHKVITGSGVAILTCHFDHAFDLPYATGSQGFLCGISTSSGVVVTSDTKNLATPGGRVTLVCKFNGGQLLDRD